MDQVSKRRNYRMDAHAGKAMLNPLMNTSSRSTRMMIGKATTDHTT